MWLFEHTNNSENWLYRDSHLCGVFSYMLIIHPQRCFHLTCLTSTLVHVSLLSMTKVTDKIATKNMDENTNCTKKILGSKH